MSNVPVKEQIKVITTMRDALQARVMNLTGDMNNMSLAFMILDQVMGGEIKDADSADPLIVAYLGLITAMTDRANALNQCITRRLEKLEERPAAPDARDLENLWNKL